MPTAMTGDPGEAALAARVGLPGGVATQMAKVRNGSPTAVAMIDQKATGDPQGSRGLDLGEDNTRDVAAPQGTGDPLATPAFQLPPTPSNGCCR
ncbi:hypothetical protein MRX96_026714 [Rhipicephalus microplus]